MDQVHVQITYDLVTQSALRPNDSYEACCCLLVFEPADADAADNSVVPKIASQGFSRRCFQLRSGRAYLLAGRKHHAGSCIAFRCSTHTTGYVAGNAAW